MPTSLFTRRNVCLFHVHGRRFPSVCLFRYHNMRNELFKDLREQLKDSSR